MQFVRAGFKNAARSGVCAGQRLCCGLCVLCVVIFSPARIARGPERQMTALAALSRASNQRSPKPLAGAPQAGRRGQLNRTREHHGSRRYPDHDRGQPGRRPQLRSTRLGSRPRRSASRPPRGTSTRATFVKSLQHGMRVISPAAAAAVVRDPGRARSGPSTRWTRTTSLYRSAGRRSRSPRRHAQLPVPPNPPGIPTRGRVKARKVTQALRLSKPSKHGVVPVLSPIGSAPLHGNAGGTRYHPEI